MIRRPSDRAAAWALWRARLAGQAIALDLNAPHCGLFQMRLFGRWAPVTIDLVQELAAETGELLADEELAAWVSGRRIEVDRVWPRCAGHPLTEKAFAALSRVAGVRDLTREVAI